MHCTYLIQQLVQTAVFSCQKYTPFSRAHNALHVHAVGCEREERLRQQVHLVEVRRHVISLLWLSEADAQQHDIERGAQAQQVLDMCLKNS